MRFIHRLTAALCLALCVLLGAAADDTWQPLRIALSSLDLDDSGKYCSKVGQSVSNMQGDTMTCTQDDILTDVKRDQLRNVILPQAARLHEERLLVQRVDGPLPVGQYVSGGLCSRYSIPSSHFTDGLPDADAVFYISATPDVDTSDMVGTLCDFLSPANARPAIVALNIPPRYISPDPVRVRYVAQRMLQMLGFTMNVFLDKDMIDYVTVGGNIKKTVIKSPTVVAKAREHYGCDTVTYMELEDEADLDTGNSHWKARNAKDEMMSAIEGIGYYTPITIAAMEDTGFYKGNYTNAELMPWGYQAGCRLFDEKCVIDGVSQYPSMFCTDTNTITCDSDRLEMGQCMIEFVDPNVSIPDYYRYFDNPQERGTSSKTDYCPVVGYNSGFVCEDEDSSLLTDTPLPVIVIDSRCLNTRHTGLHKGPVAVNALCAKVACDPGTLSYQVKTSRMAEFVTCPAGKTLSLKPVTNDTLHGEILCPSYVELCQVTYPMPPGGYDDLVRAANITYDYPSSSSSQPLGSSSTAAISSSSQSQPIASSLSQPLSSSSTAAISSSSRPQPIASSSSQPLSSSTAALSSSSQPQPLASSSSQPLNSSNSSSEVLSWVASSAEQSRGTGFITFFPYDGVSEIALAKVTLVLAFWYILLLL